MNINALSPRGVVRAQGKEMDLNSVLIYMNIYSAYGALHRQDKVNIEQRGGKKREMELSPPQRAEQECRVLSLAVLFVLRLTPGNIHFILLYFRFISVHALVPEPLVLVPSPTAQH